ncbi:hypothetical protein RB653_008445 [Dictyostelium firmibasis]|uniref:Cathepsin propeptide inhibitor domain-containing protein n=1 Tax=Dictyostelium firmibasis TaxID=79012 RepID=A0AAN7TZ17_9MYCE
MKIIICLLLFVLIQFNNGQSLPDNGILYQSFLNWMDNYQITYQQNEIQKKFDNWKTNLLQIVELNNCNYFPEVLYTNNIESNPGQNTPKFELNKYSGLKETEFQEKYCGADPTMELPSKKSGLSGGAIAGIVIGVVAGVCILGAAGFLIYTKKKDGNLNSFKLKVFPKKGH